jgi:hypothetical protein
MSRRLLTFHLPPYIHVLHRSRTQAGAKGVGYYRDRAQPPPPQPKAKQQKQQQQQQQQERSATTAADVCSTGKTKGKSMSASISSSSGGGDGSSDGRVGKDEEGGGWGKKRKAARAAPDQEGGERKRSTDGGTFEREQRLFKQQRADQYREYVKIQVSSTYPHMHVIRQRKNRANQKRKPMLLANYHTLFLSYQATGENGRD